MTAHLFDITGADVATTTDDWYTPRWIFDAADVRFDMDVAAPVAQDMRTCPAETFLTPLEDGLTTPWHGVVWCNPPYSGSTPWVEKWAAHPDGLILVPAVKSRWIGTLVEAADSLALLTVEFIRPGGVIAPIRWLNIIAGRGSCVDAVGRVARDDHHARGAYLVRPA